MGYCFHHILVEDCHEGAKIDSISISYITKGEVWILEAQNVYPFIVSVIPTNYLFSIFKVGE